MTGESGLPHVLVVGGGPAGSTVAGLLARRGWRVLLLERARFPRPKACGECVNPGGVTLLDRLGLLDRVRDLDPAPIRGWRVKTPTSATAAATFGRGCRSGLALPRKHLDQALLRAAEARGARVLEGRKVEKLELPGSPNGLPDPTSASDGTTTSDRAGASNGTAPPDGAAAPDAPGRRLPTLHVREPDGRMRAYRAPVVVGADGLRSVVARSLDAHRRRPRLRKVSLTGRIRGSGPEREGGLLVLGHRRVLGLAPVHLQDDLWNVSVVVHADHLGREVSKAPRAFLEESTTRWLPSWRTGPELLEGPWASGPFDWPTSRASAPGVLLVGDASGYYDPLTGQGIYRALRSAELAAKAVDRALRDEESRARAPMFDGYARGLNREFRWERRVQKLVEFVVARGPLRERAVERLARAPRAMRALIRVTGDHSRPHTLLRPSSWADLLTA